MATKPDVLALLLCEGVVEDSRTKNKSILNTFNRITSPNYPVRQDRLCIFVSMTNLRGEGEIDVRIASADKVPGEGILIGMKGKVISKNPLDVVELGIDMRGLRIPKAGQYVIEVLMDGELLKQRRFEAILLAQKGGGA